jgi:hypothetical protein
MANGFEKFFITVGHDIKVVVLAGEHVVAKLPEYIKTAKDAEQEVKDIVPLVQDVITKSIAFAKPAAAIGAAISAGGTNLAADTAVMSTILGSLPSLEADLQAFWGSVKTLAEAIGVDFSTLKADIEAAA